MTSETDDQGGRRPPTIELAATEVAGAPEKSAAGAADADKGGRTEHERGDAPASPSPPAGRRFASHIGSALLGAAVMAGIAAALWFTGVIPSPETTPLATATTNESAPAATNPSPNPPLSPAAAQNSSVSPDLTARLEKIERAVDAQRADPALGNHISEVAAQTKALGDNLAALTRRVDETAATSQSAAQQADTARNAADAAKSASDAASKDQLHREDLDALAKRIMALESAVKGLAAATAPLAAAGANDGTARLNIAAEALRAAVERGAPYQAELRAVQSLGVDQKATAALEPFAASGVPSAAALASELAALVPQLQDASAPRSGETTFLDRLKSNAQNLVRITPLNAPAGNDPQTVVDRIRRDAAHADIAAALSDLKVLPDAAKPLAEPWGKKATAREGALAASRQIAADALAALAQSGAR